MNKKHFIFWVGLLGLGATCALSPIVSASLTTTVEGMKTHFSQPKEITEEQKAVMVAKHQEMLTQQLKEGRITQEQFDEMSTNLENGGFFTLTMRGDFQWEKTLEKFERIELTEEQKADMLVRHQEMLTQQFEEGRITQEQFDEMSANFENGEFPMMRMHFHGDEKSERLERVELTEEQKAEMTSKIGNGEFSLMRGQGGHHQGGVKNRGGHHSVSVTQD